MTPEDVAADARIGELAVSQVNAALENLERARILFAMVEDDAGGMTAIRELLAAESLARSAITRFISPRVWLVPDPLPDEEQ